MCEKVLFCLCLKCILFDNVFLSSTSRLFLVIFFPTSYTTSSFLFCSYCPQGHQLRGIRSLFNRSSKSSVDTNSGGLRKRSISDHLLRRTASAPAKGRKKTKMVLSESVASISDQNNGTGARARGEGMSGKEVGVEKSYESRGPLIHRPISMPLDRLLQGQLSLCSPDKEQKDMGSDTVIGGYFTYIITVRGLSTSEFISQT